MKRLKAMMMVMAVMILLGMMPVTASATSKKGTKPMLTVTTNKESFVDGEQTKITVKDKVQLKVKYGKKNVTSKAVYKTSNKKVVSISKKGQLTAKKTGKATITVKYKGKTIKLNLVSKKPELTVTTDVYNKKPVNGRFLIRPEDTVQITVKCNKNDVTSKAVYKSTDSSIITVTKEGKLIPKNPGICDVTISYKGQTKTLKLTSHEHTWEIIYTRIPIVQGYDWYCDICKGSAPYRVSESEIEDMGWKHQQFVHNDFSDTLKGHPEERYWGWEEQPSHYFCPVCKKSKPLDE